LPDPASVPQISSAAFSDDEAEAINRYLELAPDLAEASLFAAGEEFSVSLDDEDGSEAIKVTKSARDITAGYLVTWRQFYAQEPGSFDAVKGYLIREARNTPAFEPIKAWSKAHNRLKGAHLEHLVLVGLADRGDIPANVPHASTHDPATVENPQILIGKQLYGDLVHWGDKRAALAALAEDQFMVAWERFNAISAALAFGYIYLGFAGVLASAVPGDRPRPSDPG
jgi:hypothetical protein